MNSGLIIQFVAVLVACFNITAAVTNNLPVRTKFVTDAVLSPDELNIVVKFAKSRGMSNVAEVETFHYQPGNLYRGIKVTSPEKVSGRKITYQTLEIFREGWNWKAKPTTPGQVISVGPFWVEGLASWPKDNELTTFVTAKGTIRVNVEAEIPIATADKIIKCFATGKILYADELMKVTREHINFSQPKHLRISHKDGPEAALHYWISFSQSNEQFKFVLRDNDVKVVSVVEVWF
jgi:hypothetical protein